jgi:hypothetical protein
MPLSVVGRAALFSTVAAISQSRSITGRGKLTRDGTSEDHRKTMSAGKTLSVLALLTLLFASHSRAQSPAATAPARRIAVWIHADWDPKASGLAQRQAVVKRLRATLSRRLVSIVDVNDDAEVEIQITSQSLIGKETWQHVIIGTSSFMAELKARAINDELARVVERWITANRSRIDAPEMVVH